MKLGNIILAENIEILEFRLGVEVFEVLEEIAVFYASALRDAIKTMTSMIEPLLIVVMGSIVGFIAMAIILPIFKMSSIVSG